MKNSMRIIKPYNGNPYPNEPLYGLLVHTSYHLNLQKTLILSQTPFIKTNLNLQNSFTKKSPTGAEELNGYF
jgi:hypothetical protein